MKKTNRTTKSRIRSHLRVLWMRSKERSTALKRDGYTCQTCGKKQSMAKDHMHKVIVHHKTELRGHLEGDDPDWTGYIKLLFCPSEELITLCHPKFGDCHKKAHEKMKGE